jgi:hypothetical protein
MGRDIEPMTFGGEDRRKYREKVRLSLDVFAQMLRERAFEGGPSLVGQEIELNLVDTHGAPSMRNADVLDVIADPAWATEVAQFNLEINVPPRELSGSAFVGLEQEIRDSLNAADAKARSVGSRLVMIGILPTLRKEDVHEGAMSANARYRVLNEQIFAARGEDMRISIDGPEPLLTHADSITPEAACLVLERRPGHRRGAGRACRELALPLRQPAVAGDQDHAVRAGYGHPAGGAQAAGSAAASVVRGTVDHLGVRSVRGEPAVLSRVAADLRGRGPAARVR